MADHTPGPWEYRKSGVAIINHVTAHFPVHVVVRGTDKYARRTTAYICSCESTTLANDENARLIATAPDGLALAEMVLDYQANALTWTTTERQEWRAIVAAARALKDKAEGRT